MATPPAIATRRHAAARQALHVSSAVFPVAYAAGIERRALLEVLALVLAMAIAVELLRWANFGARTHFERWAGPLLRPGEREGLTGATWLALSLTAAVLLLPHAPAVATMWCVCVGDPVAAAVGSAWQARRGAMPNRGRSMAGSIAMASVSAAGVALLGGYLPGRALLIGVTAAVAERVGGRLNDNITIVLGAGLAALAVT
ncbi:MAG: hypothetical protein HYR75_00625 [Gemmatimonadetes bacterium]|nr:hypothetical protein [Gemmatimonadota bacterium]MBI3504560.1 hypothetical protein [Pseudomonadota bacterium]